VQQQEEDSWLMAGQLPLLQIQKYPLWVVVCERGTGEKNNNSAATLNIAQVFLKICQHFNVPKGLQLPTVDITPISASYTVRYLARACKYLAAV